MPQGKVPLGLTYAVDGPHAHISIRVGEADILQLSPYDARELGESLIRFADEVAEVSMAKKKPGKKRPGC